MKVAICTPVHGGVDGSFVDSLVNMVQHTAGKRPDIEIRYISLISSNLPGCRNHIAEKAFAWGADWLLWLDADQRFPASTLLDLLAHDADAVGCNISQKAFPADATAKRFESGQVVSIITTDAIARSGLVEEAAFLGLGVFLVRCSTMEKLPRPIFEFRPAPNGIDFNGEDVVFCHKLRAAGCKILLDHALSWHVGHVGRYTFTNAHVEQAIQQRP